MSIALFEIRLLRWATVTVVLLNASACSGCTCSHTLVKSKPLLPSPCLENIFREKYCGQVSPCGFPRTNGFPTPVWNSNAPGTCGCSQIIDQYPWSNPYSNNYYKSYGTSNLQQNPYVPSNAPNSCGNNPGLSNFASNSRTCYSGCGSSTNFNGNGEWNDCVYSNGRRPHNQSQVDAKKECCKVGRRGGERKSQRKICNSQESSNESTEDCSSPRGKTIFKGKLKLPFFCGCISIG